MTRRIDGRHRSRRALSAECDAPEDKPLAHRPPFASCSPSFSSNALSQLSAPTRPVNMLLVAPLVLATLALAAPSPPLRSPSANTGSILPLVFQVDPGTAFSRPAPIYATIRGRRRALRRGVQLRRRQCGVPPVRRLPPAVDWDRPRPLLLAPRSVRWRDGRVWERRRVRRGYVFLAVIKEGPS